jgi:hypothetical protein
VSIHKPTEGKHRLRLLVDRDIAHKLARGLKHPRLHVEGDCGHGFKIYCREHGGYAPILGKGGGWYCAIPARRVKAREAPVKTTPVEHYWDVDEHGPVLVIPRPPDAFLPQPLLDKLPRCQLEPETALARAFSQAEKRLDREMAAMLHSAPKPDIVPFPGLPSVPALDLTARARATGPLPEPEPEEPDEEPEPEPVPPSRGFYEPPAGAREEAPAAEALTEPEPATISDVAAAVALLNELIDRVGEQIHLSLDGNRLRAQRRVVRVEYVDI